MFTKTISLQSQEILLPAFVSIKKQKRPHRQACMLRHYKVYLSTNFKTHFTFTTWVCFSKLFLSPHKFHLSPAPWFTSQRSNPGLTALSLPTSEMSVVSRNKMGRFSSVGEEIGSRWVGFPTKCPLEPGCPGQPKAWVY